jgi:hypothetical protein
LERLLAQPTWRELFSELFLEALCGYIPYLLLTLYFALQVVQTGEGMIRMMQRFTSFICIMSRIELDLRFVNSFHNNLAKLVFV